jgi:hypothetical protein
MKMGLKRELGTRNIQYNQRKKERQRNKDIEKKYYLFNPTASLG